MTYPDGSSYQGDFRQGKRNGQGKLLLPDGKEYNGSFLRDFPEGFGVVKVQGTEYRGEIRQGFRHGKGTFTARDGSRYIGQWKLGKRHGRGIAYDGNGTITFKGLWQNDLAVPEQSQNEN